MFVVFTMFYIINTTTDYIYASVIHSLSIRKSSSERARNCNYLSKIENSSYNQEIVSHPMPEHFDESS